MPVFCWGASCRTPIAVGNILTGKGARIGGWLLIVQEDVMRFQQLFGKTLRDAPADAEMVSHQLALRAGLVRPLTAGIYSWLPLGLRVVRRVSDVIREEMDAIGGQEMVMPVVHPAEIWQQSGRWDDFGEVMLKIRNRDGR